MEKSVKEKNGQMVKQKCLNRKILVKWKNQLNEKNWLNRNFS